MEHPLTRLNKFISETGFCSRREADRLIESGRVMVNGALPVLGTKVSIADDITVDGKPLNPKETPLYLAFHKPVGIICTTDTAIEDNIIDYIKYPGRIFPIGRLDRASEGLIFLTMRAGNNHEKEYIVTVDQPITEGFIKMMSNGIPILDTVTQKCFVEQLDKHRFRIILTQGLNRQIRRMCIYLGYQVKKLKRIRIMNIKLADLPPGKWRNFTEEEINEVNELIADSSKT
jgi:23S rRNA pseudouridine2604 synthase